MGIVDVTPIIWGAYSPQYNELLAWLEEWVGPRSFGKKTPDKNGIIPLCQSSNWRILAVSYAVRRAYPQQRFPDQGWLLEFSSDSDLLMFKLRWM